MSSVEPRTKAVSADWYDTKTVADEVFQQFKHEWIRIPGVRSVGLGGDEGTAIVVTIDRNKSEARERFPESIEVPVEGVDAVPVTVEFVDPSEGYPL